MNLVMMTKIATIWLDMHADEMTNINIMMMMTTSMVTTSMMTNVDGEPDKVGAISDLVHVFS